MYDLYVQINLFSNTKDMNMGQTIKLLNVTIITELYFSSSFAFIIHTTATYIFIPYTNMYLNVES